MLNELGRAPVFLEKHDGNKLRLSQVFISPRNIHPNERRMEVKKIDFITPKGQRPLRADLILQLLNASR